jgi:hypothetical protein
MSENQRNDPNKKPFHNHNGPHSNGNGFKDVNFAHKKQYNNNKRNHNHRLHTNNNSNNHNPHHRHHQSDKKPPHPHRRDQELLPPQGVRKLSMGFKKKAPVSKNFKLSIEQPTTPHNTTQFVVAKGHSFTEPYVYEYTQVPTDLNFDESYGSMLGKQH